MAEKGAYLTGTAYNRPTLFEILAQKSLTSTLEAAFKKFFSFCISFNSNRYGHLFKWKDEGYLFFNVFLQEYYLRKYSASFSETFYSLQRVDVLSSKLKEELSHKRRLLSLLSLAIFPYLRNKLERLSLKYQLEEADNCAPKEKLQKFFHTCVIKGHFLFFTLYKFIEVLSYIHYISEKSMYPSPLLRLLRVTLIYAQPQSTHSILDLWTKMIYSSVTIYDGWQVFQETLTSFFELGAFFLQFLSWWNQQNYITDVMNLPSPPSPRVPEIALKYKGICPLCNKPQHIHTVLIVSGYVFCYGCILRHIRVYNKCPITHYYATEDDLVRLYIHA